MARIGTGREVLDLEHGTCSAGRSLHYYSRGSEHWSICLRARDKGCAFRLTAPVRFPLVALLSIPSPGDPFLIN